MNSPNSPFNYTYTSAHRLICFAGRELALAWLSIQKSKRVILSNQNNTKKKIVLTKFVEVLKNVHSIDNLAVLVYKIFRSTFCP